MLAVVKCQIPSMYIMPTRHCPQKPAWDTLDVNPAVGASRPVCHATRAWQLGMILTEGKTSQKCCIWTCPSWDTKTTWIQHKASILLPLAVCSIVGFFETKAIDAVDELPGSIGDATGRKGDVGALDLGASSPLRAARRYSCHSDDRENFER